MRQLSKISQTGIRFRQPKTRDISLHRELPTAR
jgi:hypothetical protein